MDVLKTVCDILKVGMKLDNNQIWIYNQKVDIPNDKRLYVVVSLKKETVIGNNIETKSVQSGEEETVWTNLVSDIGIELFSYNVNALNRRYEVLSSMRSIYSVQKQEELNCNIGRKPTVFFDSSFASPTARIYSFYFEYRITHVEKIVSRETDYFDNFSRADMSNKDNIKINL